MTTGRLLGGRSDRDFDAIGALESTTVRFSPTRRTGHRSNHLICYINVTPFVGVMLVLLYLFMVQRVELHSAHRGVRVELPRAVHPVAMRGADREDAMIIAVTRSDKVFFRTDRVSLDQLPGKIRESVSQGSEKKVYIWADARAKYGWVAEVLDNVRCAGVEKIGFLVEQRPTPAPNP